MEKSFAHLINPYILIDIIKIFLKSKKWKFYINLNPRSKSHIFLFSLFSNQSINQSISSIINKNQFETEPENGEESLFLSRYNNIQIHRIEFPVTFIYSSPGGSLASAREITKRWKIRNSLSRKREMERNPIIATRLY